MIKCLIIDDDPFIRDLMKDKLSYFNDIELLGIAKNGNEGIEKLRALKPELVFLDVEMTDMTGFEMLAQLGSIDFQTIFVTSYSHYAIKAIRFNALDYLLKPIDLQELKNALSRFRKKSATTSKNNIINALENMNHPVNEQKLFLKSQAGEIAVKLTEVILVQGDRNYSNIHLISGQQLLIAKTLIDLENLLDDKGFYRCHKSYLVNRHYIDQVKGDYIKLANGNKIPISRRKKTAFRQWWERNKAAK
ncbi:MAG: LytTR family DNA-binding domain-containing protein [Bacteroidota bacterium]